MTKHLRKFKVGIIMGILLLSMMVSIAPSASAALITFESVLELDYEEEIVNDAIFQPDGASVAVPITIKYKAIVPPITVEGPLGILRLLMYGIIIPDVRVSLSIVDKPDWCTVALTNPNPYVSPLSNPVGDFSYAETSVVVATYKNAPSRPFNLIIKAETPSILRNRVGPNQAEINIYFTPGYVPLINVYTAEPNRIVNPQDTVTFPIEITNLGNKETLVTARVVKYPEGWSPLLSQSQIIIPSVAESGSGTNKMEMSFSITPPYGLGWHNDLETITLEFTPQFSPPMAGGNKTIGTPVPFSMTVRSRGVSTPGFEIIPLIIALGIVTIILKKRKIE
jgi:hypothetical protein